MFVQLIISRAAMMELHNQLNSLRSLLKDPMKWGSYYQVKQLALLIETFERYVELLEGKELTGQEYVQDPINGGKAKYVILLARLIRHAERWHEEQHGEAPAVCFINNPDYPRSVEEFRILIRNLYHYEIKEIVDYLGEMMDMLEQPPFQSEDHYCLSALVKVA